MNARAGVVAVMMAAAGLSVAAQNPRDRPAAPEKRVEPSGTGVVAGFVVTADERQQPVRRVSVMLASGQVVTPRTVVTDDAGRFEFSALAPGNYTLVAQKPAWVSAIYGARSATDTQGVPIAVANGQRVEGLRLSMQRGGVISGTVRLSGGQPAAGAQLQVLRVLMMDGRRHLSTAVPSGQTNDLGEFRVFGLAPGDYVVQARASLSAAAMGTMRQVTSAEVRWGDQRLLQSQDPQQGPTAPPPPEGPAVTYSPVYFPGTVFPSDAAVVTVRAGEERGNVDFALSLETTVKVTGSVTGLDGEPVSGAMVQLEPEDSAGGDVMTMMMRSLGGNRATTRADGTFVLTGVTSGRYNISARAVPRRPGAQSSPNELAMAEAMAMLSALGSAPGVESPNALWAREPLAISGQDVGPLSLALRDGLRIEGTVVLEGGGVPADAASLRIAASRPAVSSDPAAALVSRMMGSATGLPKENGTFTVSGLMPGRYQLSVTGRPMRVATLIPGVPPAETGLVVKSIIWNNQDLADTGIDLQPGTAVTGVQVTLTNQAAELSGTVTDGAGRPTGAFPIVVYSTDRAFWTAGSRRILQAQPASDGKFRVVGLPAGEYFLAAVTRLEPGDLASRQFLEELIPASLRISIRDGEKKNQDLRLAGGG